MFLEVPFADLRKSNDQSSGNKENIENFQPLGESSGEQFCWHPGGLQEFLRPLDSWHDRLAIVRLKWKRLEKHLCDIFTSKGLKRHVCFICILPAQLAGCCAVSCDHVE